MFIYLITNKVNGKIYVGKTKGKIKIRLSGHFSSAFKRMDNTKIAKAIRKYGKKSFEIKEIHKCLALEEMDKMEEFYIKSYNACNNEIGYNIIDYSQTTPIIPLEVSIRNIVTRKLNKINSDCHSKYVGVHYYSDKKVYGYIINFANKKCAKKNYLNDYDAALARDFKVIEFFDEIDAIKMMNFPEKYLQIKNKEIETPKIIRKIDIKKSKFKYVNFGKGGWYNVFVEYKYKSGNFDSEIECAIHADFKNLEYYSSNPPLEKLNFPENLEKYKNGQIERPKTKQRKLKKIPYKYIGFHHPKNCKHSYFIDLRSAGVNYRKYGFEDMETAKIDRDNKLKEFGKSVSNEYGWN